jgi:hypothetical protein
MGKSRMVDELAKEHLVIPINLRMGGTGMSVYNFGFRYQIFISPYIVGFPPGDVEVRDFLIRTPFDELDSYKRSQAFLIGLFRTLHGFLLDMAPTIRNVTPKERQKIFALGFREHMNAGQTFEKHGQQRIGFYASVLSQANAVCCVH